VSDKTYAPELQTMIERAGAITEAEAERLGALWVADEDIVLPEASLALGINGGVDAPMVTNAELVGAWEHALDAAGKAGRVDEIEAAQAAGRAAEHAMRHEHGVEKDGVAEAVRSAVLGTGVRDLLADDEVATLTAAWRRVVGNA
jgi:hypothetical protein